MAFPRNHGNCSCDHIPLINAIFDLWMSAPPLAVINHLGCRRRLNSVRSWLYGSLINPLACFFKFIAQKVILKDFTAAIMPALELK